MTGPAGEPQPGTFGGRDGAGSRARTERGWWKLLLALVAFVLVPLVPPFSAILPVQNSVTLFVPALAACSLVGWWAGGRPWQATLWVGLATWMALQTTTPAGSYEVLVRGWSLLLAGSFGLVCLFGMRQPLFARALATLAISLALALMMSMLGPVSLASASHTAAEAFAQRNEATVALMNRPISENPEQWKQLTARMPELAEMPAQWDKQLKVASSAGLSAFPALLGLQSLAALALAWASYHRLNRARLGMPLSPLREFRFNDQLVWGLIVGLTIMFLPSLSSLRGLGRNLLVFFGALYAIRGLGVLSWFIAPAGLVLALAIVIAMLFWPVAAAFALTTLTIAAFGLGIGDTWADWRRRARPTT